MSAKENYILLPTDEYLIPRTGMIVIVNQFWMMTNNNQILYYTTNKGVEAHPQTNANKRVCESLRKRISYPFEVKIAQIPVVYEMDRSNISYWKNMYAKYNAEVLL